ncbi:hypothetical protein TNCV_4748331 [Trichonephila clavipes]|nr:hypothetical protein TNCV_4748331 [Trichonephila clavipes]
MSETTQQEKTTQLGSRNETTQLSSRNETTRLGSRNETTQLCTAVDRLQPPAPPLQQNRLFYLLTSHYSATRGLLVMDHIILNHGQVTGTTPELTPLS